MFVDRRGGHDRRKTDRRSKNEPVAVERRKGDRRDGERRRQVDPTTCEKNYTEDDLEFMKAIEAYKRRYNRPFPTWTEVLEIVRHLGYVKVKAHVPPDDDDDGDQAHEETPPVEQAS